MSEDRKVKLTVGVDGTQAKQGLNEIKREAQAMAQQVSQAGKEAGKGLGGIGEEGDKSSKKVDAATKSMIQSIQRTTAAMEAGTKSSSKYFEVLADQRGLDVNALRPYLEQLDKLSKKQSEVGISAAQTANALRMVPAQMTDIVTSLAGGQKPLTVLIQQGGQLKDAFGGIGPAARAMGGYIAGMVNPLTVAAAGAAALEFAFHEGNKEAQAYNRALILTGNAAGTTANQLADMAKRMSAIGGTQGTAAAALAEMAGTGRVAATSLEYFSRVAINMEKTVGQSVAETAKDLAELGKSPVEASEKLSEKYRYLSANIYEQIKALQDQGKASDAAALAQKAYVDSFDKTTKNLEDNLGVIEKGWRGVSAVAKGAWDIMLGVGRKRTLSDQLADVTAEIAKAQKPFDPSVGGNAEARAKLQANLELQASLQELIRLEQRQGAAVAANNEMNAARIGWIKEGEKYLPKTKQMEIEITRARNEGAAAGMAQAAIEERIAAIRDKYKGKGVSPLAKELEEEAKLLSKLAGVNVDYMEQLTRVQKLRDKGRLTEKEYVDAVKELIAQQPGAKKMMDEQAKYFDDVAKKTLAAAEAHTKFVVGLADGVEKLKAEVQAQKEHNDRLGLSKEAIAELNVAKLEEQATTLEGLAIKTLDKNLDESAYELYKRQATELRNLAAAKREGAAKEVMIDQAKAVENEWKRTAESIENSLTDALMRGFESGKGFAQNLRDTLVNMFKTLVLRPTIQAALNPVTQGVQGVFGGVGSSIGTALAGNVVGGYGSSSLGGIANSLGMAGAYNTAAGWFGATGAGLTGGAGAVGASTSLASLGLGGAESYAAASGLSNVAGAWGAAEGAAAAGTAAAGGAAGTGSMLAAAGPYAAVALALFAAYKMMSGGETRSGGGYDVINGKTVLGGGPSGGEIQGDQVRQMIQGSYDGLTQTLKALGSSATVERFTAGLESSKNGKGATFAGGMINGQLFGSTYETTSYNQNLTQEQALEQFTIKLQQSVLLALQKAGDIPPELLEKLNSTDIQKLTSEGATALLSQIDVFTAFEKAVAGMPFAMLKNLSFDAANGLVAAAGGLNQLNAGLANYYDKFYSADEKTANLTAQVTTQLATLGLAMPKTREEFRGMVEGVQNLGDAAGQKTLAGLLGLASALDSLLPQPAPIKEFRTALDALPFERLKSLGNEAAIGLMAAAGGLDQLNTGLSFYYDRFYSAEEKTANLTEKVTTQLSALGLAMPKTREDFRAMIDGVQDLGTAAGQQTLAALLGLAGALDSLLPPLEKVTTATQAITTSAADRFSMQMSSVDLAYSGVAKAVDAQKASITRIYNDERKAISDRAQQQREAAQTQLETATSSLQAIKSVYGALSNALAVARPMTRAQSQAILDTALQASNAGKSLTSVEGLTEALQVATRATASEFATQFEFLRDQALTANKIDTLRGNAGSQASLAEMTVEGIKNTIKVIEDTSKFQLDALDAAHQAELAKYDQMLEQARIQIDSLKGIDSSVKSVAEAVGALGIAINVANIVKQANQGAAGIPGNVTPPSTGGSGMDPRYTEALITTLTNEQLVRQWYASAGQAADSEGVAYWTNQLKRWDISQAGVKNDFAWVVEQLTGTKLNSFDVGTNFVPSDQVAKVHKGERIVPAADNRALIDAVKGGDRAQILAENQALRDEVRTTNQKLDELSAALYAIAKYTQSSADTLEAASSGGRALQVETAV
jgi:phage-related minor tail protein